MKLRVLISMVLVTALALPVIATATRFPDVPDDHQHADAIRWASDPEEFNGNPLFRGFVDGSFGPDVELTEGQFTKVVDRLFDSVDRWTRAETAALLYHGFNGLRSGTTTTTTTTTTTQPGGNGPGEEEPTTSPEETTTTTTTTIPPFPIQERLAVLNGKIELTKERLVRATDNRTGHTEELANDVKEAADDAVDYVTKLKEDYAAYLEPADNWIERISREYDSAVERQNKAELLVEWITTYQKQTNAERKLTSENDRRSWKLTIYGRWGYIPIQTTSGVTARSVPEEFYTRIRNIHAVYKHVQDRPNYGDDTKRDLYRYVYYHTLWLNEQLEKYKKTYHVQSPLYQIIRDIHYGVQGYRQTAYEWLANDAGF